LNEVKALGKLCPLGKKADREVAVDAKLDGQLRLFLAENVMVFFETLFEVKVQARAILVRVGVPTYNGTRVFANESERV
jgi:hypothetical protein